MKNLAKETANSALATFAPPPKLTVSEWADTNRILSSESSAEPGRWMTERAEYQRGIMDALADPTIETIVIMSSAQIGKTEILNNCVGFQIDQDPCPIMVVQPTLEMAATWSKTRFSPMVRDTPCLVSKIADPKARDSGNTIFQKTFSGGYMVVCGANSPAGLASRPVRILLGDEIDRWPLSAGSEGDPVKLASKRTTTFWNRKRVFVSTPTIRGLSRIESLFEESDQRRFYCPCPHCGEFQVLEWGQVTWEKDKPDTAVYGCKINGCEITDADKVRMMREGEWRAEGESRGIAGFHLSELYSPWRSFADIVADFLEAKKSPVTLRTWVNLSLGETWDDDAGEEVEADPLFKRRENWGDALPEEVLVLTAGVDVQSSPGRLEVEVVGWGKGAESWSVDYKTFYGDPALPDVWKDLDGYLTQTWPQKGGAVHKIAAACIDSGGHHTQAVYKFTKRKKGRRIYAVKGVGGEGRPVLGKPSRANAQKVMLFPVGVDSAKETLMSYLAVEQPGPGFCHFPMERDEEYFAQLTAEKMVTRYKKGRPSREWVKKRARNEALDVRVYATAALHTLNANLDRLANKAEAKRKRAEEAQAEDAEQDDPPETHSPPPVQKVGEEETPQKKSRARRRPGGGWRSI